MQPFIRSFPTDDVNKVGPSFTHSPSLIRVKLVQLTPIITTLQKNYSKNLCWTKLQPSAEFAPYHAYCSREAQTNKQTQNCVLLYLDNWRLIDQQLLPYKFYGSGMACKKSAFYILFLHPWFMISHKVNARSHTQAHIPAWHRLIFLYYFLTCFSCIVLLACLDGTSYQYPCPALILQTNSKQITI